MNSPVNHLERQLVLTEADLYAINYLYGLLPKYTPNKSIYIPVPLWVDPDSDILALMLPKPAFQSAKCVTARVMVSPKKYGVIKFLHSLVNSDFKVEPAKAVC